MGLLSNLGAGSNYVLSLDAASAARIARLINAEPVFRRYYAMAMRACVARVEATAKDNAANSFQRPTGNLLRNIQGVVVSPMLGVVGVTRSVLYARRREFGFTGMTDSLGRYYANDPGAFYLHDALEREQPFIQSTFHAATALAVRDFIV